MPRLNIYLPDQVHELASRWRGTSNLSDICARAIKDEFEAIEGHRAAESLFQALRPPTSLEQLLADRYGLADVVAVEGGADPTKDRDILGRAAAAYLDRNICDGSGIAIAGGRQMWCTVRNLAPRRVRTKITALGMHHADPLLLHAHPNTLVTFLWLLYSPRSEAYVIGAPAPAHPWTADLPQKPHPSYFVISSCSRFEENSPFGQLLGTDARRALLEAGVLGDYAYVFLGKDGREIASPPTPPQNKLSADLLRHLSTRMDARTILVASGTDKLEMIGATLGAKLCNTLITDKRTAEHLLESIGGCNGPSPSVTRIRQ